MYVPEHFREERLDVIHELVEDNSFGTLVSQTPDGLFATHIPMLVDRTKGPFGTLRGHVARANPHWKHLEGSEALAIFMGPHAYISPSWYATGGRVPTWNYLTVHAYGTPRLIDDRATRDLIERTVARYESGLKPPWNLSGLDPKAVDALLREHRRVRDPDRADRGQAQAQPEPIARGSRRCGARATRARPR